MTGPEAVGDVPVSWEPLILIALVGIRRRVVLLCQQRTQEA